MLQENHNVSQFKPAYGTLCHKTANAGANSQN